MQPWVDQHPFLFGLTIVLFVWLTASFVISYSGGWALLARKFRFRGKFSGSRWRWQSGQMRGIAGYSHCLMIGANPEGLYLAVQFPFHLLHPPLLIPWSEVSFTRKRMLLFRMVRFELGREHSIPLWVRETLVERLKQAAGNAWPTESLG